MNLEIQCTTDYVVEVPVWGNALPIFWCCSAAGIGAIIGYKLGVMTCNKISSFRAQR